MSGSLRLGSAFLLLAIWILASTAYAQPPTDGPMAASIDAIQGRWQWEYMQVKGKPLTRKRDFYATGLRVDGTRYIMNFSEAAFSGEVVATGDRLVLQPSLDDMEWGYEYAIVMEVRGDRLYLLFPDHIWPLFVNSVKREEVIYCYRKRP